MKASPDAWAINLVQLRLQNPNWIVAVQRWMPTVIGPMGLGCDVGNVEAELFQLQLHEEGQRLAMDEGYAASEHFDQFLKLIILKVHILSYQEGGSVWDSWHLSPVCARYWRCDDLE